MVETALDKTIEKKHRNFIADIIFRLITEKPLGTAGFIITVVFLATAIFRTLHCSLRAKSNTWFKCPERAVVTILARDR